MQNICDGGAIKHGSDFSCVCDVGHMVNPFELFEIGRTTETGSQIKVCVIYGIRFTRTNCFRLGNTTETVQLNKMCVICGIQFTWMNSLRWAKRTQTSHVHKMCVIRGKQPTRMNYLQSEITRLTVNTVTSCAILCVQKLWKCKLVACDGGVSHTMRLRVLVCDD